MIEILFLCFFEWINFASALIIEIMGYTDNIS